MSAPASWQTHGWQILFFVGGIAPIVFALGAIFFLPESIKFMALHEGQRRKMEALLKEMRPDFVVPPNARFVIEDEKQAPSNPISICSANGLALITPLTWLIFACNLMGYFFLLSWTPTLMGAAHVPPQIAALAGAGLQVGGTVGSLLLCWWLQRSRFLAIAIMFVIAVPIVGSIGFAGIELDRRADRRDVLRRLHRARHPVGHQRGRRDDLSDLAARQRLGLAARHRPARRHRGPLVGALFVGLPVPQLYMWSALPFAAGAVVTFIVYALVSARLRARPELAKAQ